jgi:hypothetical protein
VLPVSNNPGAIVVMVLLFSIVALVGAIYGIGVDSKKIYLSVGIVFLLTTISFALPKTYGAVSLKKGRLDEKLSECISDFSSCKEIFERKKYSSPKCSEKYKFLIPGCSTFDIEFLSATRIGSDVKFDFLFYFHSYYRENKANLKINRKESYISDNLGNRYTDLKNDSLGEGTKFTVGTQEVIWVTFSDIHPDSTKTNIVLILRMESDEKKSSSDSNYTIVFNNIRLLNK